MTKDKSTKEIKSTPPEFCSRHYGYREFMKAKLGIILSTPTNSHFTSIQKGFEHFRSWENELKGSILQDLSKE